MRLFGWFAAQRQFIAARGALKKDLLEVAGSVGDYRRCVQRLRDALPLDEPKFRRHRINVNELL